MKMRSILLFVGCCLLVSGCGGRMGHTPDRAFVNPKTLGTHKAFSEGQGMLYTLRGGHIDMAHIRGSADQTKHAYDRAYSCVVNGRRSFTVSPAWERITNKVVFDYPPGWDSRPKAERQKIAHAVAIQVAPVVGYNSTLYHEMLTWKGAKFFLIEPEFKSSFSWEDLYCHAVGCWVAVDALNAGGDFNTTFTRLFNEELKRLQVVPKDKAEEITESVRGKWFTSASLYMKNMDSYIDDDISPCIVPGYTSEPPITYPLPNLDGIEQYGVGVTYSISSFFLEHGELKNIAGAEGDLEPLKHFEAIMRNIQHEGETKYRHRGLIIHK